MVKKKSVLLLFCHTTYVSTFSLESATHVSAHVQGVVILDTDWPVQHWLYVYTVNKTIYIQV